MENKERNLEVIQVRGTNFRMKSSETKFNLECYKIKETLDEHHYIFLPYTFETKELALKAIEKIKNERR